MINKSDERRHRSSDLLLGVGVIVFIASIVSIATIVSLASIVSIAYSSTCTCLLMNSLMMSSISLGR